jgi:predicted nucleotidyltransferase
VNELKQLDLPSSDLQIVKKILTERIPGRPVYVFGSRANGRARRRSDLDLAVGGVEPLTLRQRALLSDDFEESNLPIEVDVVDLAITSTEFRERIQRDWIMLTSGSEPSPDAQEVAA